MVDENPPQNMRRRRPPTVIDLPATEVPSDTAAAPESSEPPPPPPEPPRTEPEPPPGRRPLFAFLPEELSWTHASAGVAGGLLVVLLLWFGGVFSRGQEPSPDLSPKLAALQKQLNDLAARPAPATVDPKAVDTALDDARERLTRLERAQATPRAPVTDPVVLGRLNAAENAIKSLADNAAAMSRRADTTDASLRELNGRIDALTATLRDVQTTARSAAAGSDRASRLAVAASALRNAVEHGDPFSAELAIVKPLASDAGAIAWLEPFAASGVPGNAALGQELVALIRPMLGSPAEPSRDGGFLDRLQANAEKLVRIRPVGEETRGDDRPAILTRAGQRAAQGNIPAALAELAKLSPEARAPMQGWIAKTEARNKALDASRRLAADAVAALKSAP